jgi:hypothetical protein
VSINKNLFRRTLLIALAVVGVQTQAAVPVFHPHEPVTALILNPDARFDPLVQRMMADNVLRAMPLRGQMIYYVVPQTSDPMMQEMQIRYIEQLLEKYQRDEPAED